MDNNFSELINRFKDIKPPTFNEKLSCCIEDCLSVLTPIIKSDLRNRVVFECLFDFAILNKLELKQQSYWQKVLLDAKCTEFEEKERRLNDNNIK